jgi:alkylhydroperoxidase family enzyme
VVSAALADWRTAPLEERVRFTLALLEKVTLLPESVEKDDMLRLRELGVSKQAVEDALLVCFGFNLIDRLADSFGWHVPGPEGFAASAKSLLSHGYLMPFHSVPKST